MRAMSGVMCSMIPTRNSTAVNSDLTVKKVGDLHHLRTDDLGVRGMPPSLIPFPAHDKGAAQPRPSAPGPVERSGLDPP